MPKSKSPLRLVIDSNLWVSFLISDKQRKLDRLLTIGKVRIVFSVELLDELEKISKYPRLKKYFSSFAIEEMLVNLEPYIDLVKVKSVISVCRDPKDNFLLSLAKDGKANFLLTRDKDLLILQKVEKANIDTITQFFEKIK